MLVMALMPYLAHATESASYAALQHHVDAKAYAQTIHEANAFLQRFPQSVARPQVRFWLAEALYATQAYESATEEYRELLHEAPTFPDAATALRHLGLSCLRTRHFNAALAAFTQLLEQFPGGREREQILLYMATAYFEQGQFAEALPLYQQLQQEETLPLAKAALHLRLGHGYFAQHQFAPAQDQYRFILGHFPASPEAEQARYQLGAIALAQQQFAVAQQHFQTMLHAAVSGPAAVQARYAMAWTFYYQGQVTRAITYLRRQHLLAQPSATDTILARSYELVLLHAYREAIPLLVQTLTQVNDEGQEQRLRWILSQAYEGAGDLASAVQVLDDFVQRFPRSPRLAMIQRRRGDLLLLKRHTSEALKAYRTALSLTDDADQAEQLLLTIAELYQAQHAVADAITTWQHFVRAYPLSPRSTEIQLRLGAGLVQQGAIAQAVALYQRLLATALPQARRIQTRLQLAWAYLKGREYQRALALYGELVHTSKDTRVLRQARFWRGWLLQRQQQYEAANGEWQALLSLEPQGSRRGEILWRFGSGLMALGRYREARDRLLEVVTTYAAELYAPLAAWRLQRCLLELQQYRLALQYTPAFMRSDPLAVFNVTERFTRGERLFKAKRYQQARQVFRYIIAQPLVTPLTDDAMFMVAESYVAEGDKRRALYYYRAVTQRYGQTNITALAFYRQGMLLAEAGRLPAAVHAWRQAVQQATYADIRDVALYHLGKAYIQLHQADKALAALRRLLHQSSMAFATEAEQLHIGLMLQQLGDYPLALQVFRQVSQQSSHPRIRAEAQFWIAETHQLRGDTAAALTAYQHVAKQFPEQQKWALTALFRAGELYEALQRYQEALTMYQRVVAANPQNRQGRFAAERVKSLRARMAKTAAQQG